MNQKNLLFGRPPKTNAQFLIKCMVLILVVLLPFTKLQAQCNTLVWADEFNGTSVDGTKWKSISGNGCDVGLCGFGNGEAQRYDPNQATIVKEGSNSYLNIQAKYEPNAAFPQQPYSSSKLTTEGKYSLKYGRVEARMKLSSGMGAWPAFWMLPAGVSNWPYTGEIDIMEAKHRNPKTIDGTIHYDGGGYHYTGRSFTSPADLSTDFHIYAVEWGPNSIKWFVDGNLFHTATPNTTINGGWPFNDDNFYIILNLAVGSLGTPYTSVNGSGVEPIPADYPAKLQVDYVRVYEGSFTHGVTGDAKVYQNETGKTYILNAITGASYTWTVPSGATIASGQGTNTITVNWGTAGGDVAAVATVSGCNATTYKLAVETEVPLPVEKIHEDFQSNRNITYGNKTGVLTQAVANPSATGVNTSALVGKYARNASETYDVLNIKNLKIINANDYVYGRKRMSIDIYTSAPVGTKINLQLENSLVTTAINYPMGRQSSFKASTTVQNKWETIEFEFDKVIDANTSALSIDTVVLLFESNTNSGATYYFDNLLTKAAPEQPIIATDVLQNYDGTNRIIKGTSTGTYSQVANPGTNSVNASSNVAKYVRNASEQYDVLFFNTQSTIEDSGLLKNQTNKIMIDVYTSAPVGTVVTLNLENSATSIPTNFPTGRNSNFVAITTKQNQWETLTFYYNASPDAGTSNLAVNQMVLLFNSGSYTSDTYYFDNIRIGSTKLPDTYTPGVVYEDYQNTHNITFRDANGTYTPNTANPSVSGINTSSNVAKYVRKATELYDNFSFNTTLTNIGDFKKGTKKFAMDVYTSAPVGSLVTWQAESGASIPSNYPVGRHSVYQAVVKQTNAWHTLIFTYASAPDASTLDIEVNRFVFLLEPGTSSGNTYYFDNLRSVNLVSTENPTDSLPAPWTSTDLGAVTPAGVASFSNGTFTIKGSGSDIWETSDQFQYVNQPITGDTEIIAKINSLTNTNTYAKVGLMFRETLTTTSKHAMVNVTAAAGLEFLSRDAVSGQTIQQGATGTSPKWLRITRVGNVFTSYSSDNGTTWTPIGTPRTIAMPTTIYAGIAVTSHANGTLSTGIVSDVTVKKVDPTNTLPAPWVSTDLGAVTPAGEATFSNGTFTIKGSGSDIWETSDQFQYVNQPITGDAEIIAKVNSLTNTNTYAKVGLMFRETLTTTSKHAMANVTAAAGLEFLSRDAVSAQTIQQGVAGTSPKWLRITRVGNVFTSYSSDNGTTWTQIGTPRTIAMPTTIYAGIAVTSHANGTLSTGIVSDVTVKKIVTNPTVNLALAKTATASSEENPTLSAGKTTDGDATTRWASSFGNTTEWVYVDLGSNYTISRVVLKWEAAFATQYKVQISTDNIFTDNETVNTQTNSDGGTDDLTVSGTGRYIRVLCTTKALTPYGYSLFEMEAYGSASTAKLGSLAKEEISEDELSDLGFYPNPASDYINLTVSGKYTNKEMTIYDVSGNRVMKNNINTSEDESSIDISRLPKGIYILNFKSDQKSFTKKLIKK